MNRDTLAMHSAVYVVILLALAAVFATSGVLKLLAPAATRSGLTALGLPTPLTQPWFAVAWPVAELLIAIALLVVPAPLHAAVLVAAAIIFGAFLVVIVRAARRPEAVHCHCFGAADSAPVTSATVVRNSGLLLLALVALLGMPHGSAIQALGSVGADSGILQLGLLMLAAVAVILVMQTLAPAPDSAPAAPTPSPVEKITVARHLMRDLFGATHDVRRFTGADRAVIYFVSTTCAACRALAPQIQGWLPKLAERGVQTWLVLDTPPEEAISTFTLLGAKLLHNEHGTLAAELGITSFPSAIYFGADGTPSVEDGPADGPFAIESLIENVLIDAELSA